MNRHALRVLEFQTVLEVIAARALSDLGRERILALTPETSGGRIQEALERVGQLARFLGRRPDWNPPGLTDARKALGRLELEGSTLEGKELFLLGLLLTSGRELTERLSGAREELSELQELVGSLYQDDRAERRILNVVDREGTVLDTASRELARIRRRKRSLERKMVGALEALLATLPERIVVQDASVTLREGRYVIPIRREGRGEVGGVVLDESATGATLFVEPPRAQEMMAELRDLEREETREVLRILRDESQELRPTLPLLRASQEALADFDSFYARARAALAWDGVAPTLLPPQDGQLEVVQGRHPLLLMQGSEEVVPFDLRLEAGERALVVSGPNTGGKSVFLKALGLLASLTQSGVIPPVGEGTRIPLFTNIFADIGDEQSISESLSTFSAHLENLKEIVEEADDGSLVLVDEMGTGTDPQEGAALSRAILEHLVEGGALTVVTSHLGALKRLDTPGSGVVNASLQFDPDRIEPTYQLLKGRPGRSYGLAIARRLGFPARVLDRAEQHLPREEARMEELLATLERKEKEASELVETLSQEKDRTHHLREGLEARKKELEARERTARARAQEEARQLLLEARGEVEKAIQEVRDARDRDLGDGRALDQDEANRRARRRVEEAAQRHHTQGQEKEGVEKEPPGELRTGHRVRVRGTGSKGILLELEKDRAVMDVGGVRLQVAPGDLEDLGVPEEKIASSRSPRASSWQGPEAEPETEIDLRGLRVTEVELEVERALDQALLGGLGEVRIIHGKGTGALREAVAELLGKDARVKEHGMADATQGGAGVTVVKLK